jgi:hypothetical protein
MDSRLWDLKIEQDFEAIISSLETLLEKSYLLPSSLTSRHLQDLKSSLEEQLQQYRILRSHKSHKLCEIDNFMIPAMGDNSTAQNSHKALLNDLENVSR